MKVESYAKINIGLNILYKRLDGYHELESIMALVSLHDNMTFELTDSEIAFSSNIDFLNNNDNLIYVIAKHLQEEFKVSKGAKIHLEKIIPISGGMGGGSSNAATTIITLNKLWELNLSLDQMLEIGLKFGADIPFCIHQSPSIIKGVGEVIEPFTFNPDFDVIVVKMPFGLSTKRVFEYFDATFAPQYTITKIKKALVENNRADFIKYLGNNLEDVSIGLKPQIQKVKDTLEQNGCFTSLMSGSGPTVLGFIDKTSDSTQLLNDLNSSGYEAYRTEIIV